LSWDQYMGQITGAVPSRLDFSRGHGNPVGPVTGAVGLDYSFSREHGMWCDR
jgi:hypothetical protein